MSLNIKNERVHGLAREAAVRTGLTQTAVIEQALERLLRDLDDDREARIARAEAWFAALPDVSDEQRRAARAFASDLYDDETGLPR